MNDNNKLNDDSHPCTNLLYWFMEKVKLSEKESKQYIKIFQTAGYRDLSSFNGRLLLLIECAHFDNKQHQKAILNCIENEINNNHKQLSNLRSNQKKDKNLNKIKNENKSDNNNQVNELKDKLKDEIKDKIKKENKIKNKNKTKKKKKRRRRNKRNLNSK